MSVLRRILVALAVAVLPGAGALHAQAKHDDLILATTTSTQDSGLLDSVLPVFSARSHIQVKVIAVGTGAALEMARRGDADAVLVHAPEAERGYVASGDLVEGRLVMHNDFLIIGPAADPAHLRGERDLGAAMKRLAATGPFIGRGDGSGTEKKEQALWKLAGVDPDKVALREETGQGMGATLLVAEQRQGYTLTDRATYLALRQRLTLVPLVEGAPGLLNVYHAYVVNPAKHTGVRLPEARAFVTFMVDPATQRLIGDFGRRQFGQPLFYPDAGKSEESLGLPAPVRE